MTWLVDEKLVALSRADVDEATTAALRGGGMGPGRAAVDRVDVGEAATTGLPVGMDADCGAVWAGRVTACAAGMTVWGGRVAV